jgi:mannose/fructose/N-acetylgalactosamine-specific phosphotransferase system component IIC
MIPWVPPGLIFDPGLPAFIVLGLTAGLLALDDTALAQTWFGQPLPAAVLTGYLLGDPLTGLAVGLPLQLVVAGNLPVGQTFTGDPTTAAVAAVGGALLAGRPLSPVLLTDTAGTLPLLGWVILGAGMLSMLGHPLIQAERRANGVWMLEGLRSLRDGRLGRIEGLHNRCLITAFVRGLVSGILFTLFMYGAWVPLFSHLPEFLRISLGTLPLLLPGLGVGTLIDRYGLKISWPWVALGMVGAFFAARYFPEVLP